MQNNYQQYFDANKEGWNKKTAIHKTSSFYDLENFKKGKSSLNKIELDEVGDVKGKALLHLQCHFGMDTLSWAKEGAIVTGVDISDEAIQLANELSAELNIPAQFICCNVYDTSNHVHQKFDIIFTSYGTIGWLPSLKPWAKVIAQNLKPGGVFIYSTCSYSKEENEMEVEWMMKEFDLELVKIPVEENWNLIDTGFGFRFYPYLTKSEGFFCSVLRKKGESEPNHSKKNKKITFEEITKKEFEPLKNKVELKPNHKIFRFQNEFKLVNASLFDFMNTYGMNVYFKKTGTTLGELKHADFLPHLLL